MKRRGKILGTRTIFTKNEIKEILLNYNLGELICFEPVTNGTVETNYFIETTLDKFVFRYYEERSKESVQFEVNLIRYLKKKDYPCPGVYKSKHGKYVNFYNGKPYVLFEFIQGVHEDNPGEEQERQLIEMVAKLQNITRNYKPFYKNARWNYGVDLCRKLARREAKRIDTANSREKLKWLENELAKLQLPQSLPKGICHCDFHFSNVLFKDGKIRALLDFDDANYTYLLFDLAYLIEPFASAFKWDTWENFKKTDSILDFSKARKTVKEYMKHRPLSEIEKRHLFDVYKLSVLMDCVWYFERGNAKDFYEKRKIDALNELGRGKFFEKIFKKA